MLMTKRKPVSVSEILVEEFMKPMELTQAGCPTRVGFFCALSGQNENV